MNDGSYIFFHNHVFDTPLIYGDDYRL